MAGSKKGFSVVIMILIFSLLLTACITVSSNRFATAIGLTTESTTKKPVSQVNGTTKAVTEPTATLAEKVASTHPSKKETTEKKTESKTTEYSEPSSDVEICSVSPEEKSEKTVSSSKVKKTSKATKTTKKASYSKPSAPAEFDCFDDCAFIGNSRLLAVGNYNLARNVYAVVGLNVETVYTKKCEGSKVTVINELDGKDYKRVILMFGDNECGWASLDDFEKQYKKVIGTIREKLPDAKIYLVSVLPISAERSKQNQYGYNINSIAAANEKIKKVAGDTGCAYIDAGRSITNSNGYLPDEASSDGCHLNKEYTRIWLSVVAEKIKEDKGFSFGKNNEERTSFEFRGIFRK